MKWYLCKEDYMRLILSVAVALSVSALHAAEEKPRELDGYWALNGWAGYMGICIHIEGEKFRYWFYSDVKDGKEPKYPLTGKVKVDGDTITLKADLDEKALYDITWHVVSHEGRTCLLGDTHWEAFKAGKLDTSRLLNKVPIDRVKNPDTPPMNYSLDERKKKE
jgi:hypothetical protein